MEKQRFKVGDKVTYKSRKECKGRYYFNGSCQKGFIGEIRAFHYYEESRKCWKITVTAKAGGIYSMLESEFKEYDVSEYPEEVEKFLNFD